MALTKATYSMIEGAFVNVLDYGADNTGATDCSAAIAAAIATGKSVFFPAGSYEIDTPVTISGGQGQILFGEGPQRTTIITPAAAAAFEIPSQFMVGIRDMTLLGQATGTVGSIGVILGTRGADPGGAGANFANTPRISNLRITNCAKGIYIFGCNAGSFRDILYETCTIGLYVQPVGAGNCNANYFSNMYFYGCDIPFYIFTNADGGNDAQENYCTGGIEASTSKVFVVRGLNNTFDLWTDNQSGATGPDISSLQNNYYQIKNSGNVPMPTWGLNKALIFAGANIQDQPAFFTKAPTNSGAVLDCTNGLGATIQTSTIFSTGDNGQVLVTNTSTVNLGTVLLNCLLDVPSGYKISLVSADSAIYAGIVLQIPNSGSWTYYGFANNDTILNFAAAGTTYTILKLNATTLVRLI
jgi:hypothetical protein